MASSAREQRTADAPAEWDQVSEAVAQALDRDQLYRCLDTLTEPQLQAIFLAFYSSRTHTDIAILLDVPLGTVKARIRAGLVKLRDCMQQ